MGEIVVRWVIQSWRAAEIEEYLQRLENNHIQAEQCIEPNRCEVVRLLRWLREGIVEGRQRLDEQTVEVVR